MSNTQPKVTVTVTFKREECDDDSPDLSYLQQDYEEPSTKASAAEYRAQDKARLEAYYRGDWHMIGIRAVATIWIERPGYRINYTLESPGLWGIESDSRESYLQSVYKEECSVLQADIEAMRNAEFKL